MGFIEASKRNWKSDFKFSCEARIQIWTQLVAKNCLRPESASTAWKVCQSVFLIKFTAWKVSKYGYISGPCFPVFSQNIGKYGPEKKILIWTLFPLIISTSTTQKMKFSIKDFISKCDQIRRKRIWSHLLKKSLKAHGQISEKRCFEKYCSCNHACQVSAL